MFFHLASTLLSRFNVYRQPEDIKSSIKYFRFLRINFHSLKAYNILHGELTSRLVQALAESLVLGSGDMIQEMEEMVTLIPEVLAWDVSTDARRQAITAFTHVTKTEMFRRKHTQPAADRVIQILREATVLKPDSHASYAFASCLAARFETMHVIDDYDEAITIADKIVAAHSPGDSLTKTQTDTVMLISILLVSRLNSYSRPEYLEDAIHRIHTFVPCLQKDRKSVV